MNSELLTCLLKFIECFPDYLSALSRTLLCFFGQPLLKQLYVHDSTRTCMSMTAFVTCNDPRDTDGDTLLVGPDQFTITFAYL